MYDTYPPPDRVLIPADFRAVATYEKTVRDHRTGRKCTRCGGVLHDSIVNFGESLPAEALQRAFDNATKADLCLVLGSSLTVSPANEVSLEYCFLCSKGFPVCTKVPCRLMLTTSFLSRSQK